MSKVNNLSFGVFNWISQTYVTLTRQPFEVTDKWFDGIHKRYFTPEVQAKYDPKLYEELGLAEGLRAQITISAERRNHVLKELENLKNSFSDFRRFYTRLKQVFHDENIKVNRESDFHKFLEQFDLAINNLSPVVDKHHKISESGTIDEINKLEKLEIEIINNEVEFKVSRLVEYDYIDKPPPQIIKIGALFRIIDSVHYYFSEVNSLIDTLKDKNFLITGNAGVGKSNFSARLTFDLNSIGLPVIFLQGKAFSGETTNFEETFSRLLSIPIGYSQEEILAKLNSYGKVKSKRVTIIIDGLNETTFTNSGFSPIWTLHLNNFLHSLKSYPWLIFIGTLRFSYLERVWPKKQPEKVINLVGFGNEELINAVKKYFDYYKIEYPDDYAEKDLYLFRTPLLLSIFCQMLNPKRQDSVKAILGFKGYASVFQKYIEDLSIDIKAEMQLPSTELVKRAFDRCSDAFLDNLEASLPILNYYEAIEKKQLEANFSHINSLASRILEEYLIYIRDYPNNSGSELVFHTHQEVGGYLLAKRLIEKYSNIQGVMESDFLKEYIIGDKDGGHQLRDDILEFLTLESIDYVPYLEKYIKNDRVQKFILLKLQREPKAERNRALRTKLIESFSDNKEYEVLLDASKVLLTDPESPLRIIKLSEDIVKLEGLDFDMVWTQFVYQNAFFLTQEMESFLDEIRDYGQEIPFDEPKELKLELAILLLDSTVRDLRDLTTMVLIEFGAFFPEKLFEHLYKYSTTTKIYIYERLASICYGICLRKQNDNGFVKHILASNAKHIYELQFAEPPIKSTYNYIVIDSFKHLIDLAIEKRVFELNKESKNRLKNYQFTTPSIWNEASQNDKEIVNDIAVDSYIADGPDPLRMDFVIYTISRLLKNEKDGKWKKKSLAVANIYRRIIDLGYKTLVFEDREAPENKFFYGVNPYGVNGKVDRLGKKYSWIAFFDYAGYLLKNEELNIWYSEKEGSSKEYQRLSDVRIEVSNTHPSEEQNRLYLHPMLERKDKNKDWARETLYHTTIPLWDKTFDDKGFTLINGKVEERADGSYDTRTYMMIEAFFVKREDIEGNEHLVVNREFDWRDDINAHSTISNVYFGELYWADNVSIGKPWDDSLPLENSKTNQIPFEVESATSDYAWESESETFPTLNRKIPSVAVGKYLKLKADTTGFTFLDDQNELATRYFEFNNGIVDQDFTYLRNDLLNKYLVSKKLLLMYQIKQHSYDNIREPKKGSNFRGVQFFFPHLNKEK